MFKANLKRSMSSANGDDPEIDNSKTNLIINYLPQQMTDQDFRVLFAQIGDIRSAKIIRKKTTGYSYGFGFVDYLRPEDAERAIQKLNGFIVEHKKIKVAFARPSGESIKQANLYVRNLPLHFNDHDVRALFSQFGNIIQCRVVGNRGVAFVLFDLHDQAMAAIDSLDGITLDGSTMPLNVKFANDNNQKLSKSQTIPRITTNQFQNRSHNFKGNRGQGGGPYGTKRGYSYSNMAYEEYPSGPMRHMSHMNREHRFNPLSNIHQSLQSYQSYSSPTPYDTYNPNAVQPPLPMSAPMQSPPPPPLPPPSMAMHGSGDMDMDNGFSAEKGGYILFAYNIGPETNEYNLGELFGHYGKVVRVNVIRKGDSGESKGFGFVTMKNYNEALNAIQALNGYNYSGKPLQVSFKK